MKRHESIVSFSREHHFGLLFCWKLRQGIKKQVALQRIKVYIKYFWEHHLREHFREEEEVLFAGLDDKLCHQAVNDHRHIQSLLQVIIKDSQQQPDLIGLLADKLDKHIRFEERILFPHLEKELPESRLRAIGAHLLQQHPDTPEEDYPDTFWTP